MFKFKNDISRKKLKTFEDVEEKAVKDYEVLTDYNFFKKIVFFLFYKYKDFKVYKNDKEFKKFKEYGLTIYCGRQGSGKSISMTERLEYIRKNYPNVKILTNYGYVNQDEALDDWAKLLYCRNEKGIVFAIDEIQNEFDVYDSRNFNLDLLKVITQQRKQGIKIYASSQVFTRVSKPLREQCFEVVECFTFLGRWTFQKCFDADDYNFYVDNYNPTFRFKVKRKWRKSFVQTDKLRSLFDSYAVVEAMKKIVKKNKK